jgi:serine/threonine-protein phosphatase PP1 catalytic subunit
MSLSEPQLSQRTREYAADVASAERQKQKLEKQRAMWESTLPRTLSDHMGYFSTAHHLDYVHTDETPPS